MSDELVIREMSDRDVGIVHRLGSKVSEFDFVEGEEGFWPRSVLEDLVHSRDVSLVAEKEGEIVGFLIVLYHYITKKATFEDCYVVPNYRNESIAVKLYQEAEDRLIKKGARFVCSYPEVSNTPSIRFLENGGFLRGYSCYWMHKFL
jgi:ribosomal protein S18 acetylase RimI-like enzyme